jgi:hypothetical protein
MAPDSGRTPSAPATRRSIAGPRTGTRADDGPVMGKSWAVMGNIPPEKAVNPGIYRG